MKGIAQRAMNRGWNAWELIIGDFGHQHYYAYEIKIKKTLVNQKNRHELPEGHPVTIIQEDEMDCLKGLAQCLRQMGILDPSDATKTELDATKRHLEDFRKLIFKGEYDERDRTRI